MGHLTHGWVIWVGGCYCESQFVTVPQPLCIIVMQAVSQDLGCITSGFRSENLALSALSMAKCETLHDTWSNVVSAQNGLEIWQHLG